MRLQDQFPAIARPLDRAVARIEFVHRAGLIFEGDFCIVAGNKVVQPKAILCGRIGKCFEVFICTFE